MFKVLKRYDNKGGTGRFIKKGHGSVFSKQKNG